MLPTCERYGMGVILWSPLNGGWLTGKYRRGQEAPAGSRTRPASMRRSVSVEATTTRRAKLDAIEQLARSPTKPASRSRTCSWHGSSSTPAVTSTIIGPKTPEQLDDLLAAADLVLDADVLDAIDAIVPPGTDAPGIDHFTGNPALTAARQRR